MNDYKELVQNLREEAEAVQAIEWDIPICTENHIREAADAIEELTARCSQLERECNIYAKCFRINRTDDVFTNHAVFKLDYNELINNSEDEIALALAWGLARMIENHSGVKEDIHDG